MENLLNTWVDLCAEGEGSEEGFGWIDCWYWSPLKLQKSKISSLFKILRASVGQMVYSECWTSHPCFSSWYFRSGWAEPLHDLEEGHLSALFTANLTTSRTKSTANYFFCYWRCRDILELSLSWLSLPSSLCWPLALFLAERTPVGWWINFTTKHLLFY